MKYAVVAPYTFDGQMLGRKKALLINGQFIEKVVPVTSIPNSYDTVELSHGLLAPGLIDLQVNGGGGVMFNGTPTTQGLHQMADAHASAGVARIVPTVITDNVEVTKEAVEAAYQAQKSLRSGLLGIHIEGPFFSHERKGVHSKKYLRQLEEEDWDWIARASIMPCIITLAPEQVSVSEIKRMVSLGVRVSAGHSNCTFETMRDAADVGLSGVTHLYNAMSPLTSREPGLVGAGLTMDSIWCWVIADGHHLHPQSLQLAHQMKPKGKLILVSDSMATVGMSSDTEKPWFDLYGEHIEVSGNKLVNSLGQLAGSAISLADAIRYVVQTLGWSKTDAIAMASLYPAEYLGVENSFGSLRPNRVADLTWFDDSMNVVGLWRAGHRVF